MLTPPSLSNSSLPTIQSFIESATQDLSNGGEEINFSHLSLKLAIDVIGKSAFGFDFGLSRPAAGAATQSDSAGTGADHDGEASGFLKQHIYSTESLKMDLTGSISIILGLVAPVLQPLFRWLLGRIPGTTDHRMRQTSEEVSKVLDEVVRRRSTEVGGARHAAADFLSAILLAARESPAARELFTRDYVSALAFEHLLAGSATTAFTVSSVIYLVSKHPEVEKKLLEEIDAFGFPDRKPTADDLHREFPYLDHASGEGGHAVYTVSPLVARETSRQVEIRGYTLPKVQNRFIHRNPSPAAVAMADGHLKGLFVLRLKQCLLFLYKVVIPTLLWILPEQCKELGFQDVCASGAVMRFYSFLRYTLINLFYIFWFYPLYVFSFILSTMWYSDIAKMAFERSGLCLEEPTKKNEVPHLTSAVPVDKPAGFEGVIIGIGEQVYSALLLTIFYIEVIAIGYIPFIGKAINFLLLSWIYAYYCFEYKWNLSELSLDKRLNFFELYWAFFAGFGSPCVLAIFFFSPLISYGVMAILFPLFVLTATGTNEQEVISSQRRSWRGEGTRKLPIFYAANILSMKLLQLFPEVDSKVR